MITCTLNEKKYMVDYIPDRALREIESAAKICRCFVALPYAAVNGEIVPERSRLTWYAELRRGFEKE